MKAFLAAVVVAVAIGWGALELLDTEWQQSAPAAYTTEGARITSPGDNLVQF